MTRIGGKACIVTGAGSGIGRASALRLAEEGGSVLAADISDESLSETVDEIARAGGVAIAHRADVSDSAQVDAMIAACVERFGSIDVLVNNAGVNLPGVLHEVSDEEIDRTLGVNVRGPIYGCRAAIPHMLRQGGGSIINMSSVNGIVSEPFLAVYSASKGAIVMLTKGVALDYATGHPLQRDLSGMGRHADQPRARGDARRPRQGVRRDRQLPAHRASGRAA